MASNPIDQTNPPAARRHNGWRLPSRSTLDPKSFGREQCLGVELHDTIEELRQAVTGFVQSYKPNG
jgi:hypothetical protein